MEYEFIHDTVTGNAKAKFSFEHQVFGPWLEVEVGQNMDRLTHILTAIDEVTSEKCHEKHISGSEYSLLVSRNDAHIKANGLLNGTTMLPDELTDDDLHIDENDSSSCGLDDFRTLLLSWAKFTKI